MLCNMYTYITPANDSSFSCFTKYASSQTYINNDLKTMRETIILLLFYQHKLRLL